MQSNFLNAIIKQIIVKHYFNYLGKVRKILMKLLVLDGNSIFNRAFYGIKLLTAKDGTFTNAIYGFLTMLHKIKEDTNPDAVAVAFDMRAPTFRHKEYDGYKAQRKGMPPELAQQLPILKELLTLLGYRIVECEGYEADDILGTLARVCTEEGHECVLATGDRDSLQLVNPSVTVRLAATKFGQPVVTVYDEAKIKEDYGVTPHQLIDIKALQGDSSDNIPGVSGIGAKGAADLIQKYGSIEAIYQNFDQLDLKPAMRKKLEEGKESAFLSYKLGTIRLQAPIDTNLEHYHVSEGDVQAAVRLMAKLELFSLIKKWGLDQIEVEQEALITEQSLQIQECDDTQSLLQQLQQTGSAYFLVSYRDKQVETLYFHLENTICTVNTAKHADFLKAFCESEDIKKYTHDVKPLYAALYRQNIGLVQVEMDTMLAGYLLNPSSSNYEIERMATEYGVEQPQMDSQRAEQDPMVKWAAIYPALYRMIDDKISQNTQHKLLHEIELPLAKVLAQMEELGFAVDKEGIAEYGEIMQNKIDRLQDLVYEEVGYQFNLNSPKQLGEALFIKLGLPAGKKTKTGYSTNAEVLEKLRYEHPVVELILEYRTLAKIKSTYCDGLLKVVEEDGRIHSSFNQTETRTGRISSTEPNLQNIPVRTDVGRELRKFFVAKEGCVLVDADYSQIELRVLAHVANDSGMIEAFKENDDIHRNTAAQVFHMPREMVTPLMRSRAKAVNFGIIYGIGAFSLAKNIGVTRKEAEEYIKTYLDHFSGVRNYMTNVVEHAKETGYVETLFGRRRYLPELSSSNFNLRSFGERVAMNMPIQGTAADIIKIAMIRVVHRLEKEGLRARLILQVHDELIVEAPEEEAPLVQQLLTEEMEQAIHLSVPMVAEATIGKTWYDAKA